MGYEMESSETVQILVQAGALGLCFYLIYVNRKAYNGQFQTMLKIIESNTEVMAKLSEKIDELIRRK